ncbi:MAG: hypothetical protein ACLU4N_24010, partial [Butyricimonas faecihominis]
IYTFANTGYTPYLIAFIAAIALFIITNIFETKLLKEIQFLHKLEECSRVELEYLAGNFKNLPTGEEYKDPSHPYAHDLDIFGEDSLFQSVNRTVTPHGREKLREWLLHPLKSGQPIIERQQAIEEFAREPEWCHVFRQGQQPTYYPHGHATNRTMAAGTSRITSLDTPFPVYSSGTDGLRMDIVYCLHIHIKYSITPFLRIPFL